MLITLLVWAYSLLLFYVYGSAASKLFIIIFHLDLNKGLSIPVTIILGLAVLTSITSYLSLLIPISGPAALLLLAGAVLALTWNWGAPRPQIDRPHYVIGILIFLAGATVLAFSTNPPSNPDTALYHAQSIRWIETYRVVPGLANIHYRLAENSSWMLLNAAFSFAFLRIQSLHLAGSAFLLVSLVYFLQGFQGLYARRITISNVAKCLLFLASIYFYRGDVSSAGTDLPTSLLIWIIVMLLVEKVETGDVQLDVLSIAIFALSTFAMTVKLSATPLLGIAFLMIVQRIWNRQVLHAAALFAIAFFLALPWMARSMILSGYLIFPVDQIDFFAFDWKYPRASLDIIRTGIIWFARFPLQKWATFVGLSLQQWLPLWYDGLPSSQKVLFLAAIASPIGLFLTTISAQGQRLRLWFLPFILNFVGVIFWLLTAPNVRFGYGFLIGSISLLTSTVVVFFLKTLRESLTLWVMGSFFLLSVVLQGFYLINTNNPGMLLQHIVMPADYLPSRASPCPIKNAMLYCHRVANQCNYDLFPCIANPQPNVEMRGTTFADGFRRLPPP